jgi:hypothetical protein
MMMTPFASTGEPRLLPYGFAVAVLAFGAAASCSNPVSPAQTRSVEIVFRGPVLARPDMPASAQPCMISVLVTRVHPSWRGYAEVPMSAAQALDAWQITLHDVPVDEPVRFRINDKNWCDQNPTGTVLRDVTANGVPLTQNATTPGPAGDEPGFAFVVDEMRQVRQ